MSLFLRTAKTLLKNQGLCEIQSRLGNVATRERSILATLPELFVSDENHEHQKDQIPRPPAGLQHPLLVAIRT